MHRAGDVPLHLANNMFSLEPVKALVKLDVIHIVIVSFRQKFLVDVDMSGIWQPTTKVMHKHRNVDFQKKKK